MPSRSPTERSLAHCLELHGDLLECAVGCGCLDAGHQPDQALVALLGLGPAKQAGFDNALIDEAPHRAAKPVWGPSGLLATVSNSHHVAPGLAGAHAPHRRQPGVQLCKDVLQVSGVTARP